MRHGKNQKIMLWNQNSTKTNAHHRKVKKQVNLQQKVKLELKKLLKAGQIAKVLSSCYQKIFCLQLSS